MKQDKEKPETSIPAEEQKAQPEAPKPAPQASLKEVIAKQAIEEEVTKEEDTYLRIFGKPTTRVNRRMGVVLCYAPLSSDLDALRDKCKGIAAKVEVY